MSVGDVTAGNSSPNERILTATTRLLAESGLEGVSTRAVSTAAGVQAPTIYRLFGDMRGLLDAVAAQGFQTYLDTKTGLEPTGDPVEDLRAGWDLHVGFGLANPALYRVMQSEPRPGAAPPAAASAGAQFLAARIRRIAESGRLRVNEERAAQLVQAAGRGTTLTLLDTPEDRRDTGLSAMAREAVITAISTEAPVSASPGPVGAAVALRAALQQTTALTGPEQSVMTEWLDRISAQNR